MLCFSLLQIPQIILLTQFPHPASPSNFRLKLHFSPKSSFTKLSPANLAGSLSFLNSSASPSPDDDFDVELCAVAMIRRVSEHPELHDLVEVVVDLGRKPPARFPSGDFVLSDCPITRQDFEQAASQIVFVFCFLLTKSLLQCVRDFKLYFGVGEHGGNIMKEIPSSPSQIL
ncbi:hypothetical protein GH714_010262 [Hevea brasiliensis]|uniref:Uncharacterized protein n=1 Tax=Hevea brasiliensis TaxID=3981 RepID=A0A6A6KB20_HEVBR|nr:hypothetical protein GH714_010262 [Hevea brasiliensis]